MRNSRPIKVNRSARARWQGPALLLAFTAAVSAGVAGLWQGGQQGSGAQPVTEVAIPAQLLAQGAVSLQAQPVPALSPSLPVQAAGQEGQEAAAAAQAAPPEQNLVLGQPLPEQSYRVRSEYFDDAAFVGDSITTGIALYDVMSGADVLASTGVSIEGLIDSPVLETDQGQITILQALALKDYRKVYLMVGANGLGYATTEQVLASYTRLLDALAGQLPEGCLVYVQSILPVHESKYTQRYNGNVILNSQIREINEGLMQLAGERGFYYLDLYSVFADETGAMPEADTPDGVHITSDGYMKWFDYLKVHAVYDGVTPTLPNTPEAAQPAAPAQEGQAQG